MHKTPVADDRIDDLESAFAIRTGRAADPIGWPEIRKGPKDGPPRYAWLQFRHRQGDDHPWLHTESGLDATIVEALLAPETRPRCAPYKDGVILNLRGVNLNPGADIADMISIRLWVDPERVVSIQLRRLMAVEDMKEDMTNGRAPETTAAFVVGLASRLTARVEQEIVDLSEQVDDLEEGLLEETSAASRAEIARMRRTAVVLRRFVGPQRDALNGLAQSDLSFVTELDRVQLREAVDRVTRLVEDLDAIRERCLVLHDQITERQAEDMNRHMLVLSIGAAIFLPLTFLTGLLGMNVGGLPWAQDPL